MRQMSKRRTVLNAALVIAIGYGTARALIPGVPTIVYDPTTHIESIAQHIETIVQWAEQAQQMQEQIEHWKNYLREFKDFAKYREMIDGAWRRVWQRLPEKQTVTVCSTPIRIEWVGWTGVDEFKRIKETRSAAEALDELRLILDNRATSSSWAKMRDHLETVWGDVPVTTNGITVEAAHREMGTATAQAGEVYQAIIEKQKNIAQLKADITAGELPPGDLERKMTMIAAEQLDAELLMVQTANQNNRLAVHQLGFQAHAAGNAELNRLKDREHRLQLMGAVYFSPASPKSIETMQ